MKTALGVMFSLLLCQASIRAQTIQNLVFTEAGSQLTEALNGMVIGSWSDAVGAGGLPVFDCGGSPPIGGLSTVFYEDSTTYVLPDPSNPGLYTCIVVNGAESIDQYYEGLPFFNGLDAHDAYGNGTDYLPYGSPFPQDVYIGNGIWEPVNISVVTIPEPAVLLRLSLLGLAAAGLMLKQTRR